MNQLVCRVFRKLFFYAKYAVSIPISFGLIIIRHFFKITLVKLFSDRIGHYALNTELILCTLDENPVLKKNHYLFYTCSSYVPICNDQLHKMWKRIIFIIPFSTLAWQVDRLMKFFLKNYRNDLIKSKFEAAIGDYFGALKKGKIHLIFTSEEKMKGEKLQNELGIPVGAKFVCLIVRDSEYLKRHLPNHDWSYHDYRNVDIENYKKAALFLAEKGYYVIRMGKYVKKKFEVQSPFIIDYANSSLRSDFMDIYLSSRCAFFISTTTGLDSVPRLFRKPGILTNVFLPEMETTYPHVLFTPKKLRHKLTGHTLTFKECYKMYFSRSNENMLDFLQKNGLEIVENSADELLSVVEEMCVYLQGVVAQTNEDKIAQEKFWDLFLSNSDNHVGISVNKLKIDIKISNAFLRKNIELLNYDNMI